MKRAIRILLGIVLVLGLFMAGMYTGARVTQARMTSVAALQQQVRPPENRGWQDNPPQSQDGQPQNNDRPSEKEDRGGQRPEERAPSSNGPQQDGRQSGRDNGRVERQPRSDWRAYGNPGNPGFGGGAPAPRQMGRGTGGMHFLMFPALAGGALFSLVVLALAVWGGISLLRRAPAKVAAPAAAVVKTQPCASCGKPLQADWSTCPFCGSPVPPAAEEASTPQEPQAPEEPTAD